MIYVMMMVYACQGEACAFHATNPDPVTLPFCVSQSQIVAAMWSVKHPEYKIEAVICKVPEA